MPPSRLQLLLLMILLVGGHAAGQPPGDLPPLTGAAPGGEVPPAGNQQTLAMRSVWEVDSIPPAGPASPVQGRREKKSPLTAVALSALLPGAGQVYTEQYWKVPLILGLGGYWIYEWKHNNDRYREFRGLYTASLDSSPPEGNPRYLSLREFYKDQRDSFTWYLGILYLLNVVDAYVGAELYDFDVGPDLSSAHPGVVASIKVRF